MDTKTIPPEKDLDKERDERCVPIAREALKIVAAYHGELGDVAPTVLATSYNKLAESLLKYYLEKNVRMDEFNYINKLMLQAVSTVNDKVANSINMSLEIAQKKTFGKAIGEVTMKELDAFLRGMLNLTPSAPSSEAPTVAQEQKVEVPAPTPAEGTTTQSPK